jgi:hypothetical protein
MSCTVCRSLSVSNLPEQCLYTVLFGIKTKLSPLLCTFCMIPELNTLVNASVGPNGIFCDFTRLKRRHIARCRPLLKSLLLYPNYVITCDKKQEIKFWWYHAQVGFEQSQQTQFDIFLTKMLQNTSRCHVTASIWILCNILEDIPHALDVHAQRVLTHISWKGYLIGSLSPKINIHLMAYKKKQSVWRCLPSKILLSLSI